VTTKKLTTKQERFVDALMGAAGGNATEAARLAGYSGSDDTLRQVGSENLTKPHVRAAIDARRAAEPLVWGREELQRFWSEVASGKPVEQLTLDDGKVVTAPAAMRDRLKAAELLGKSQALFVERHKHEGSVHAAVTVYLPDNGRSG
jgi:phage terminase small subunit